MTGSVALVAGMPTQFGTRKNSDMIAMSTALASWTIAGLITRSESSPMLRVSCCEVKPKSTPRMLFATIVILPSVTSCTDAVIVFRTVNCVGLRIEMVSPTS
jgi:hypothetical protein